jgi:hypothetical protein
MKFRIHVQGKDSISEGVSAATAKLLTARGMVFEQGDEKWDEVFEKEEAKLARFVKQFVEDGEGGDDAVTLEFNTHKKTCTVVRVAAARREQP